MAKQHTLTLKIHAEANAPNGIQLITTLKALSQTGTDPKKSWIAPGLEYNWTFSIPFKGNNTFEEHRVACKTGTTFDLFSRAYPTVFEAQLDEAFEAECWRFSEILGGNLSLGFSLVKLWMATQNT